jgi:hypothetical protein
MTALSLISPSSFLLCSNSIMQDPPPSYSNVEHSIFSSIRLCEIFDLARQFEYNDALPQRTKHIFTIRLIEGILGGTREREIIIVDDALINSIAMAGRLLKDAMQCLESEAKRYSANPLQAQIKLRPIIDITDDPTPNSHQPQNGLRILAQAALMEQTHRDVPAPEALQHSIHVPQIPVQNAKAPRKDTCTSDRASSLINTSPDHRCVASLGTSPRTPISASDPAIQQPSSWINLFRSKAAFGKTEEAQRAINLLSAIRSLESFDLQNILRRADLPVGGNKIELQMRLVECSSIFTSDITSKALTFHLF